MRDISEIGAAPSANGASTSPAPVADAPPVINVTPAPLDLQYILSQVQMADGSMMIAMQMFTPLGGPLVFFMPGDFAKELARRLSEIAGATSSGLVLPPQ